MNGVFTTSIAGGDIHCFELARAAIAAGYVVHFWGGHALREVLAEQKINAPMTLTDRSRWENVSVRGLRGQLRLFSDFTRRFMSTRRQLSTIQENDIVYGVSDYWFDVLPAIWSPARRKMMIWHMQAPSFREVVGRSRPDVDPIRLASLHYWSSQNLSLHRFRRCSDKRLFHVHPAMRLRLLAMGYRAEEIKYMSFGMESEPPAGSEPSGKVYDACWIGRVHRQKGIDDLLATLIYLSKNLENFRAVIIGNVKKDLGPRLREMGLEKAVELPGFVSETEKFKLFRSSQVYLMPSRFEGSPRVIGEALLCGMPVVAYALETYPPIFGNLAEYLPCFEVAAFQAKALELIKRSRAGETILPQGDLKKFIQENSWETLRQRFLDTLRNW